MAKGTIVVNRGTRTYNLVNGANGEVRTLAPGASIEVVDDAEAKTLLRYHDIQDIKDVSPQVNARIRAHEAEIQRLQAENDRLKSKAPKGSGDSLEELNEASAGTGFTGPGGPGPLGSQPQDPATDPTRQETTDSEEATRKADKANKQSARRR